MGSGLVYAIVIVVWVAYLVPSWLHRQELGTRSVDRYHQAMRVVSKGTDAEIVLTEEERYELRAQMRRRRMIVLAALGGVLLLSTILAAVGAFALWVPAIPLLASAVYVTNLRRVVVAEKVAASRAMVARRSRRSEPLPRTSDPAAVLRSMPRPATTMAPTTATAEPSKTVRVRDAAWSPVDVPLPTYVTAPKAVRPHRVIDLTRPGEWTEAQKSAEEARLAAVAPSRDEVFDRVAAEEAVALVERLAAEERRASGDH
jgi:hypothetical protein